MRRRTLVLLGAAPAALIACGGGNDEPAALNASPVVANLVDGVIVANYRDLEQRAAALVTALTSLQAAPADESRLDEAQARWKAARAPWERGEAYLFGPVDSLGIDPAMDSWPLNTADLRAFVNANPAPTQALVENASDELRGFHALEYLLFGDGVADNDKAASELSTLDVEMAIAQALALQARTQDLRRAWTDGLGTAPAHANVLKQPGTGRPYASWSAVLEELINAAIGLVDEVASVKLAGPLGATQADADPTLEESQYSWNTLDDLWNNLQGVLEIHTGRRGFSWTTDTPTVDQNGLYAFVAWHDRGLAERVHAEIVAAQRRIALTKGDGIDTSPLVGPGARHLRQQITDPVGRTLITDAIAACTKLRATLESDVRPLPARTRFAQAAAASA
jgi:predicted lipoprotein